MRSNSRKGKRAIIIAIVAIASVLGLVFAGNALSGGALFREAGELFSEQLSIKNSADKGELAIKGKDFEVSKAEFDNLVEQNMLDGSQKKAEAIQLSLEQYIIKRSLYYAAVSAGFEARDEDIHREIENSKAFAANSENDSEYRAYIEGTGMTEDEYWASQFDSFKLHDTIALYTAAMKAQYGQEHGDASDVDG